MYTAKDMKPYDAYEGRQDETVFQTFDEDDVRATITRLEYAAEQLRNCIEHKHEAGTVQTRNHALAAKKYDEYEAMASHERSALNCMRNARDECRAAEMNIKLFINHHCK